MSWMILVVVLIVLGFVVYKRKNATAQLSDKKIKTLVDNQMKRIDEMIVSLSIEGKTISLPVLLSGIEESKVEHPGDDTFITATDNLRKDLIKKYASHIPTDEAYIENGDITIWCEFPGCYERHLQRRYNNILFPPERRIIAKSVIEEARRKDKLDRQRFLQDIKDFSAQVKNQQVLSAQEAVSVSRKAQSLIEVAASIGGDLKDEIQALETTEENVEQLLNEIMPEGANLGERISSYSSIKRIPFMAQLHRKDTPILTSEEIPTLLSEDLSTMSIIGYISRSFADFKPSEEDIKKHLDNAIGQGFDKHYAQEIINAWNEKPITTEK